MTDDALRAAIALTPGQGAEGVANGTSGGRGTEASDESTVDMRHGLHAVPYARRRSSRGSGGDSAAMPAVSALESGLNNHSAVANAFDRSRVSGSSAWNDTTPFGAGALPVGAPSVGAGPRGEGWGQHSVRGTGEAWQALSDVGMGIHVRKRGNAPEASVGRTGEDNVSVTGEMQNHPSVRKGHTASTGAMDANPVEDGAIQHEPEVVSSWRRHRAQPSASYWGAGDDGTCELSRQRFLDKVKREAGGVVDAAARKARLQRAQLAAERAVSEDATEIVGATSNDKSEPMEGKVAATVGRVVKSGAVKSSVPKRKAGGKRRGAAQSPQGAKQRKQNATQRDMQEQELQQQPQGQTEVQQGALLPSDGADSSDGSSTSDTGAAWSAKPAGGGRAKGTGAGRPRGRRGARKSQQQQVQPTSDQAD